MAERLWWAYGVVASPASLRSGLRGLDGQPVELVEHEGLAALVSPVPARAYSSPALEEALNDLESVGRMAREHEAVLDEALAAGDVVPFRMCTLYASQDAVRAMLAAEHERLGAALARVRGAIELGVKAFALPRPESEAPRPASGAEYLKRRLAARDQAAARGDTLDRAVAELHARLTDQASAAVLLRPQDRRLSGREHPMVLNGAYLVPRGDASDFGRLVERLARRDDVSLELTGPWPPYHFAEVRA